jgi:hypothetical protein
MRGLLSPGLPPVERCVTNPGMTRASSLACVLGSRRIVAMAAWRADPHAEAHGASIFLLSRMKPQEVKGARPWVVGEGRAG